MSVDYDGVGGVGVLVTDNYIQLMIDNGLFSREEFEDDQSNCMDSVGIPYSCAGSFYQENARYFYFLVGGKNLPEINSNAPKFIESLASIGIVVSNADLIVISDLMVW